MEKGHAALETALLLPWMVLSFMAVFDVGMYAYALVSTESAARVVAMYASASQAVAHNPTNACSYALAELRYALNVGSGVTTCSSGGPVQVSTVYVASGADGLPAAQVSVTYTSSPLIPVPGMMAGSVAITRTVQLPIRG